jgi:hypothetical protein
MYYTESDYSRALPLLSYYFGGKNGPYVKVSFRDIGGAIVAHYPHISWYVLERVYVGSLHTIRTTSDLSKALIYNGIVDEQVRVHMKAWEAARRILYTLNGFEVQPLLKGKIPAPISRILADGKWALLEAKDFYEVCWCAQCQEVRHDIAQQARIGAGGDEDEDGEDDLAF